MSNLRATVESVICTGADSINWDKAFDVFDVLNRDMSQDRTVFDTIGQTAQSGDRQQKLNALALIDGVFKNCNGSVIKRLVVNPVVLGFSNDIFTRDPAFHRQLCSYSAEWMMIAQKNVSLTNQFIDWQKEICSYRFKYVMTESAARKFTTELTACLELLMMFNQAMNTAMTNHASPNDPLLNEILPNIHEIHTRIKELKPTISDNYVRKVIGYIEEYCQACKLAFSDFSQVGTCDLDGLNKLAARGIPRRDGAPQAMPRQEPIPSNQRASQQPQIQENILIDFGSPLSAYSDEKPNKPAAANQPNQPIFGMPQQMQQADQPSPAVNPNISTPPMYPPPPQPSYSNPMDMQPPQPIFGNPMPQQPQQPIFGNPMPQQQAPQPQPPQNQFNYAPVPQQAIFQPPLQNQYQPPQPQMLQPQAQQGYGVQPQYPTGLDADDDESVPNDEFMDFLQNISTKH